MNMIIFNDNYPKLHNQVTAKLLSVEFITINRERHKEFLEYDTIQSDGSFFPIENGQYIHLVLLGNKHIPFTTLRRYSGYKFTYYKSSINKEFKIVVKKDPQI